MNFKEFTTLLKEARFREAPSPALLKQIKKIAELYFNEYNSKNADITKLIDRKKIVSFEKNKHYKEYFAHFKIDMPTYFTPMEKPLGKVKVIDLETKEEKVITVFCVYGNIGDEYAAYSENFETVNLYDKNIKGLSLRLVESKILHEITHAFQEYKGVSSRYRAATDSEEPVSAELYYKEPIEYDTHLNEVVYNIRQKHQELVDGIKKAKDPATKRILENRLDLFFTELRVLTKAQPEAYFDLGELTLPSYVANMKDFLDTVRDDRKLWTKFKLKMSELYQKLTDEDVQERPVKEDDLAKKVK